MCISGKKEPWTQMVSWEMVVRTHITIMSGMDSCCLEAATAAPWPLNFVTAPHKTLKGDHVYLEPCCDEKVTLKDIKAVVDVSLVFTFLMPQRFLKKLKWPIGLRLTPSTRNRYDCSLSVFCLQCPV